MKTLENKLPPPLVALVIGAAMWGVAKTQPPWPMDPELHHVLARVIGLFAAVVAGSAMLAFRRARTTIDPVNIESASRLVTSGIFRFTRNPMYVGLTALLLSWSVRLAVPWALLGPVIFALFTHRYQIIPEERVMSAKFGPVYEEYRQRVRRWI